MDRWLSPPESMTVATISEFVQKKPYSAPQIFSLHPENIEKAVNTIETSLTLGPS